MLSPFNLPEGVFLLITDELSSPADFILHRSFIAHIKDLKRSKSIVVSVSEDIARWRAIGAKFNVNLAQHLTSGSVDFVDALAHVQPPLKDPATPALRGLFDRLVLALRSPDSGPILVILDDISSLEWIGFSFTDICRFTRALRALCLKANATLIIRHHNVTPNDPDDLFRHLLQLCTYHMDVRPLSSGRSGSVSGEVALHAGPGTVLGGVKLIPRSSALQYRLTDTGSIFFERGTGGGVL